MSEYSGHVFGHQIVNPDTPGICPDTPDVVSGHSDLELGVCHKLFWNSPKSVINGPNSNISLGTWQQLQTFLMYLNLLSGSIPISFGNLNSLTMLNLSHNNLSGLIPITLTELNLSCNHLEGEVPTEGVFKKTTALSLEVKWQLCGVVLELHMPLASMRQCYSENWTATLSCKNIDPNIRHCVHHITDIFYHLKKEGVKSTLITVLF